MGIDVCSYRQRIGLYSTSKSCLCNTTVVNFQISERLCLILCLNLTIGILLLISEIEPNPGPNVTFQCKTCSFQCTSTTAYADHQFVHSQDKNFRFACPFRLCARRFKKHRPFRVHVSRDHKQPKQTDPPSNLLVSNNELSCLCSVDTCNKLLKDAVELRKHLTEHLRNNESVTCPFVSCPRSKKEKCFSKESGFASHWSQYHRYSKTKDLKTVSSELQSHEDISPATSNLNEMIQDNSEEFQETVGGNRESETLFSESNIEEYLAKFYLKLETKYHVPESTVQLISEDLAVVSEMIHSRTASRLKSQLQVQQLPEESIENISTIVLQADTFYNVHHKGFSDTCLASSYLRRKYYTSKFDYIEPESLLLGKNEFNKKRYAQYVPIKKTLEQMLKDPTVREQVKDSFVRKSTPDVLKDYTDGEVFKNSQAGKDKESIHLILFQDGLELVNPLASARTKHKSLGVYFTLGNLHPKHRFKVDTLQVAQIFFEKDLTYFGQNVCFGRLVEDLKILEEEGVEFEPGKKIKVYTIFISGDNLGHHIIGGFMGCFIAEYFCRFCTVRRPAFLENPELLNWPMRTIESYEKCAKEVAESLILLSSQGIKFSSIFNTLKYFHVCSPGLPPCLAHDLYLGIIAKDLLLFIKYFIRKKWFTLDVLNRRIVAFKFKGPDARDRPPTIADRDNRLKGNAIQNWTLLRFFGLIIGDLVQDINDPVWHLYLQLKQICEFISAPAIHESQVTYLDSLIEDYLTNLKDCNAFKSKKKKKISLFIAKHHFLRHYASAIFLFGPLCRLWTMSFESKHSWMRGVALACKNFIHVTKTIAVKSQLYFAYNRTNSLFNEDVTCKSIKTFDLSNFSAAQVSAIRNSTVSLIHASEVKIVEVGSYQYKKGVWIILKHSDNGLEVGSVASSIQDESGEIHVLMDLYGAVYDHRFGHFVVQSTSSGSTLLPLSSLENFYPTNDYPFQGKRCLSLKYSVVREEDLSASSVA